MTLNDRQKAIKYRLETALKLGRGKIIRSVLRDATAGWAHFDSTDLIFDEFNLPATADRAREKT